MLSWILIGHNICDCCYYPTRQQKRQEQPNPPYPPELQLNTCGGDGRGAESAMEVARGMKDFRAALLLVENQTSAGLWIQDPLWDRSLERCIAGLANVELLLALWSELNHWVACRLSDWESQQRSDLMPPARLALHALECASWGGEDALNQVSSPG